MLTFSDVGQKKLRLREGRLSADVVPQLEGKPMLVQTRTALLSVLGTQFEVEAGLTSTALNVNEGTVRLRRNSDGSEVDVPAHHLVVDDDAQKLTPRRVPDSVNHWKSQLNHIKGYYGKWVPASAGRPASLKAIPLVVSESPKKVTLRLAGVPVNRSGRSSILIEPDSRFVVRGFLDIDTRVYFGIRVSYPNGEFAGMFRGDLQEKQPIAARNDGKFEEVYELSDFSLDPAVHDRRNQLAAAPDNLVLDGTWVFTFPGTPSGLVVTEVELLPPEN